MDLCIAMGCPDVLPLHYGWHCISQLPATAAQSVLRLHSVQSAPERLLQGRPPQLGGKDLPLPSPSTGIGSEQTCLEQHARSPAAPSAAGAGHRQSAEITGDRQGRTMPAARAECRSAEESSLRHAAGSAGLHSRANVEGPAGSLGEQQSLPAVVQRPPVQPPSAAEQPVASSANKGSPRCEVSAQEVQSGGEVRVQQAAAPSPPQGQGGSETSIASAKHCKTPREKPCSDGQQPPQAPATWSKDQAKQLNTLAVPVARAPKAGKGKVRRSSHATADKVNSAISTSVHLRIQSVSFFKLVFYQSVGEHGSAQKAGQKGHPKKERTGDGACGQGRQQATCQKAEEPRYCCASYQQCVNGRPARLADTRVGQGSSCLCWPHRRGFTAEAGSGECLWEARQQVSSHRSLPRDLHS